MNDTTTPPRAARPRRKLLLAAAATAIVLAGGGAVGWTVVAREDKPDCDSLSSDAALRRSLGDAYREDMDCGALGTAIRSAATGAVAGRHTLAEARAMRAALTAVAADIERRQDPVVAPDLRAPLAAALADYAQDTQEILSGVNGEYTRREDDAPWRDGTTVRMPARVDDLVEVLRSVSQDPAAYAGLRAAHVRQCAAHLAEVTAGATGARYTSPARSCAAGLGHFDGIADDIPESQGEQWRSDVLLRLKNTAGRTPSYETDPVRHIAGTWQQAVTEQVAPDQSRFLKDDSSRIVDIWTAARGEGTDSRKVNDLQADVANDAGSSAGETQKALKCTRHPTECG
ncbi:hypothetical protein [Streptomyces sp. KAU_LT]|uniref:hypothetical protein n=1 Tax=Streptomyces sp. KAU_LT TaxID=3046669 RepID=UPI0024B7A4C5|nr:hypothetical protein [Streptomyces sp. KAU_LT]MDI9832230.1 hypothetical protein [Streptomyces sp. KAU_LT]